MNEIPFSFESMGTKARFEKEAKDNSEMACFAYFDRDLEMH